MKTKVNHLNIVEADEISHADLEAAAEYYDRLTGKESVMKTTGKYSHKLYRCTRCGHEQLQGTNHWGEIYPSCPKCQWKNPRSIGSRWECLESMPEGYQKPEPWKTVKLGDICEIKIGVKPK